MSDKITTALVLRTSAAEWTTIREHKGVQDIAEQCEVKLELPAQVQDLAAPEAVAEIKGKCGGARGRLSIAMPTESVLLRVLSFPTTDLEEIRGMAELQVDKFSPFPIDHMCVGAEVLARTESNSRVLVAAVQRDLVQKMGDVLSRAGLFPREVDVEVLGWWRLMKDGGAVKDTGRQAFVLLDEKATELIVVQDGVPVMFRSLGARSDAPGQVVEDLAEEINYTLTTLEAEWGVLSTGALHLWHREQVAPEIVSGLAERCLAQVETHPLDKLPKLSEGLARRAAARDGSILDLAPAEWRATMEAKQSRRSLMLLAGSVLGVWLFLLAAVLVVFQVQNSRLGKLKAEANRLRKPAQEVAQIQEQARSLKKYSDRQFSALECIREVSERLPPGIDLNSLTYKKFTQVYLRGEADDSNPIFAFFEQLEGSSFFPKGAIAPEAVTDENRGGRRRAVFRVTCSLPPGEGAGEGEAAP